ncbi:MAG: SPFH domain-containing protein [Phycisphaerales bacterium]
MNDAFDPTGALRSPEEGEPVQPSSTRRASVQLSRGAAPLQSTDDLMATANKSLSDALSVTLRIVQFSMVILFLLFLGSGLQSVREGQRAIRLVFGRVQAANLPPGFQWSFPFPVGELVKVDTGTVSILLDSQFWPMVNDKTKGKSIDSLSKDPRLKPDNDGSLITADANLAHAQWRIEYQRKRPEDFAANMLKDQEQPIVTAACSNGIVRAVAQTKVEDLLKQAAGETGHVAEMAKAIAQKQLDELKSGIEIQQFQLTTVTPPMYVREAFNSVQSAASNARKAIEQAETIVNQLFNAQAGEIEPYLVSQIDAYELAVTNNDAKAREATLTTINEMLEGRPVTVDGNLVENKTSGEVAKLMSEARQYKGEVVNQRRAELATFKAKLSQYRSNPSVMLNREWTEALSAFLERDSVQLLVVPKNVRTLEIQLTEDFDIAKQRDIGIRRKAAEEARQQRDALQRATEFNTTPKTTMNPQ